MRRAFTYPKISCTRDAKFYHDDAGDLPLNFGHGLSIRGPVLSFRHDNGRYVYVSAARMLYEAFIKEGPISPWEPIHFKDFDDSNISLDNLELGRRYSKKAKKKKMVIKNPDDFDDWLGPDSFYL